MDYPVEVGMSPSLSYGVIKEIKLQYYNHKPSEYWKLADMFLFQKFCLILEYYLQLKKLL